MYRYSFYPICLVCFAIISIVIFELSKQWWILLQVFSWRTPECFFCLEDAMILNRRQRSSFLSLYSSEHQKPIRKLIVIDQNEPLTLHNYDVKVTVLHPAGKGTNNNTNVATVPNTSLMLSERSKRFPSVDTRLKVYTSSWYLPPCSKDVSSAIRFTRPYRNVTITYNDNVKNVTSNYSTSYRVVFSMDTPNEPWDMSTEPGADIMFVLNVSRLLEYISDPNQHYLNAYNKDVIASLVPSMNRVGWKNDIDPPIILQYGDTQSNSAYENRSNVNIPRIQKFRRSIDRNDLDRIIGIPIGHPASKQKCLSNNKKRVIPNSTILPETLPGIIWKLNTERHYVHLPDVDLHDTIPYSQKIPMAVFRGAMTGTYQYIPSLSDEDNCHAHQRCNMVMQYAYSSIIDARFTGFPHHQPEVIEVHRPEYKQHWDIDTSLGTTNSTLSLRGDRLSIEELLKYKAIIMLEGNDVSSGLKWALYSTSVVIATYPFLSTSWAMEELLEPYVHFVPVKADLSDLNEVVQWIINHENDAEQIGKRGKLWIEDLLFHPDAKAEEEYIQDEILNRYSANFFSI